MERKIGEIFEYNGEWYQCLKGTSCKECDFSTNNVTCDIHGEITCTRKGRNDDTSVIFKKLEKVGEPYVAYGKVRQQYKLHAPLTITNGIIDKDMSCDDVNLIVDIELKQNKEDMEENKLNLKPFDIQKAREGKPVCTRDGRKARIICFDAKRKNKKSIIALIPSKDYPGFEDLIAYPNDGNYYGGHENDGDLMMLPEKKEGWVNVYREESNNNERLIEQTIYKTRKDAFDNACPKDYITTIKINWDE